MPRHAGVVLFFAALVTTQALFAHDQDDPLKSYVYRDDPNAIARTVSITEQDGTDVLQVYLCSGAWLDGSEVSQVLWKHWVTVVIPRGEVAGTAFLMIGGGSTQQDPPPAASDFLVQLAKRTGAVTAHVTNVPNQPLAFLAQEELDYRYEDDILAYSWRRFLDGEEAEFIAHFPMARAAVRAMDAVQQGVAEFNAVEAGREIAVEDFVLSGASKRGWTAWLAGGVDGRVAGIAPIVIDMLNVQVSFDHHWRAYGEYSQAVSEYVEWRIMDDLGTPRWRDLQALVDPYMRRDAYAGMPKLILNAAGDEFFLPDSWQFYYNGLPGPKALRYIPNAGHGLRDTDVTDTIAQFFHCIVAGEEFPSYDFHIPRLGIIEIEPRGGEILSGSVWVASNPDRRDFRLPVIGEAWERMEIQRAADGTWRMGVPAPEEGWTAFFMEVEFADPTSPGDTIRLTSGVCVTPNTLPHPPRGRAR